MELLQYGVNLKFTKRLAIALQERKVSMQLGNLEISTPPTTDNGTSKRLSPVPGLLQCLQRRTGGSEQQRLNPGPYSCRRRIIYKTASNTHIAVTAVQEQLEKVSQWYQKIRSEINSSKAQAMYYNLNNKAVGQTSSSSAFPAMLDFLSGE